MKVAVIRAIFTLRYKVYLSSLQIRKLNSVCAAEKRPSTWEFRKINKHRHYAHLPSYQESWSNNFYPTPCVHVVYESPILGLVDDVEFSFPPERDSIVEYRSALRLRNFDFDANRKRIKALRLALEKKGWTSADNFYQD
ncbi:hypothetical protein WN944_019188 [Citrus x changshan-huyou]|uniref:Uncharacterized protein n=1 Tax=Citrus x changshan-huyou TaxID=2935761 RepID=A0AAP0QG54_9ROSI